MPLNWFRNWAGKGVLFIVPENPGIREGSLLGLQQRPGVDKDLLLVGSQEFEGEGWEYEHR